MDFILQGMSRRDNSWVVDQAKNVVRSVGTFRAEQIKFYP